MKRINIKESLIRLDRETDFKYTLTDLYEACSMSDDRKKQLVQYIEDRDIPGMSAMLSNEAGVMTENVSDDIPDDDMPEELKQEGWTPDIAECPACGDFTFNPRSGKCTACSYTESLNESFEEGDMVWVKPSKKPGRVVSVKGEYIEVEIMGGKDPDRRDVFYPEDLEKEVSINEGSLKESRITSTDPMVKFRGRSSHTMTKDRKWDVDFDEEGNIQAKTRHGKPYYFGGHINDETNDTPQNDEDNIIAAAREQHALKFGGKGLDEEVLNEGPLSILGDVAGKAVGDAYKGVKNFAKGVKDTAVGAVNDVKSTKTAAKVRDAWRAAKESDNLDQFKQNYNTRQQKRAASDSKRYKFYKGKAGAYIGDKQDWKFVVNGKKLSYDQFMKLPQDQRHELVRSRKVKVYDLTGRETSFADHNKRLKELMESYLVEGAGAGYEINCGIHITGLSNVTVKDITCTNRTSSYNEYDVTLSCNGTGYVEDLEAYSYYYGDTFSGDHEVVIDSLVVSVAVYSTSDDESVLSNIDYASMLIGAKVESSYVYGGGWSHSTFDGTVANVDKILKDSFVEYAKEFEIELYKMSAKLTDEDLITDIDETVSGANQEYDEDDEDLDEAYTHFTFKSGANPYIAKTEDEAGKMLRKYKNKAKKIKDGQYEIDDSEESSDKFAVDAELTERVGPTHPEESKISDRLMSISGTTKVEFDWSNSDIYKVPENHLIVLAFCRDGFDEPYFENRRKWKTNVLAKLRSMGWTLEDPMEDNDSYLYMVLKKAAKGNITEATAVLDKPRTVNNVHTHTGSFSGIIDAHLDEINDMINANVPASHIVHSLRVWVNEAGLTKANARYAQNALMRMSKMRSSTEVGMYIYNIRLKAEDDAYGSIDGQFRGRNHMYEAVSHWTHAYDEFNKIANKHYTTDNLKKIGQDAVIKAIEKDVDDLFQKNKDNPHYQDAYKRWSEKEPLEEDAGAPAVIYSLLDAADCYVENNDYPEGATEEEIIEIAKANPDCMKVAKWTDGQEGPDEIVWERPVDTWYVSKYEGGAEYEPAEGGYYYCTLALSDSESFGSKEEARQRIAELAKEAANEYGEDAVSLGSTNDYLGIKFSKYVGDCEEYHVEAKKGVHEKGKQVYESLTESESGMRYDLQDLRLMAREAYDKDDLDFWHHLTDEELRALWKGCQITKDNPWGAPYDDEVYNEMDDRGLFHREEPMHEKALTRSQRHNQHMDKLFSDKRARDARMVSFIKANSDMSDEEIKKFQDDDKVGLALKNLGLHDRYWSEVEGKNENLKLEDLNESVLKSMSNTLNESTEEDGPYSREEIEKEIKSLTQNFTRKKDTLKSGYKEENDAAVNILKKHYKKVTSEKRGQWYELSFSDPIDGLKESLNNYKVTFYMDSLDDNVMSGPHTTTMIRASSEKEAEKKLMDSSTDKYYIPTIVKIEQINESLNESSLLGKRVQGTNSYGKPVGKIGKVVSEDPKSKDHYGNYDIEVEYEDGSRQKTRAFFVQAIDEAYVENPRELMRNKREDGAEFDEETGKWVKIDYTDDGEPIQVDADLKEAKKITTVHVEELDNLIVPIGELIVENINGLKLVGTSGKGSIMCKTAKCINGNSKTLVYEVMSQLRAGTKAAEDYKARLVSIQKQVLELVENKYKVGVDFGIVPDPEYEFSKFNSEKYTPDQDFHMAIVTIKLVPNSLEEDTSKEWEHKNSAKFSGAKDVAPSGRGMASCKIWKDTNGIMGNPGEEYTLNDLSDYWKNNRGSDPVLAEYKGDWKAWLDDTTSQMEERIDDSLYNESKSMTTDEPSIKIIKSRVQDYLDNHPYSSDMDVEDICEEVADNLFDLDYHKMSGDASHEIFNIVSRYVDGLDESLTGDRASLKESLESFEDVIADSINVYINQKGFDPNDEEFVDEIVGDLERGNYDHVSHIDGAVAPDNMDEYNEWYYSVVREVNKQLRLYYSDLLNESNSINEIKDDPESSDFFDTVTVILDDDMWGGYSKELEHKYNWYQGQVMFENDPRLNKIGAKPGDTILCGLAYTDKFGDDDINYDVVPIKVLT